MREKREAGCRKQDAGKIPVLLSNLSRVPEKGTAKKAVILRAEGPKDLRSFAALRMTVFLIASSFLLPPSSLAQISFSRPGYELPTDIAQKFDQFISLDLRDASVIDVVKFLSTKAGLNIIASQNVTSRVTLFLKDVTIGNAFEIILISAGLAFREENGILYVMTEEEYAALYGETYRDQRKIKMVQLKYTDPARVGEILGGLKSAIGKIIMDKQTGTLVLIDTEEKIQMMEEAAGRVDIPTVTRELPTQTEVFELSYNKAAALEPQVKTFLTEGVGVLQFDEKTNRIFVNDFPNVIEKVRKLVEAFDRKTRQVFIESKIVQIALSNQYQMGIEWENIINEGREDRKNEVKADLSGDFPISSTATQFGRVVVGDLGSDDIIATMDMLHTFGDTRTLASPQITVEHNQEATILVGTREAYVTSTVSQAESTTTTSESITFIDVGVSLKVLPTINKDGFVSMKIAPEVSSTGEPLVTANGNEIPIVDTTKASTQVTVKDGHTVLIGGLMQDNVLKTVRKIPILGDIPWFGALFRSIDDSKSKTELVIFLTPHIVEGDEPQPFSPTASGKPFEQLRKFE